MFQRALSLYRQNNNAKLNKGKNNISKSKKSSNGIDTSHILDDSIKRKSRSKTVMIKNIDSSENSKKKPYVINEDDDVDDNDDDSSDKDFCNKGKGGKRKFSSKENYKWDDYDYLGSLPYAEIQSICTSLGIRAIGKREALISEIVSNQIANKDNYISDDNSSINEHRQQSDDNSSSNELRQQLDLQKELEYQKTATENQIQELKIQHELALSKQKASIQQQQQLQHDQSVKEAVDKLRQEMLSRQTSGTPGILYI